MNAEEKLLKIINYYGINHQLRKFNEETFELKEVVLKREFIKDNIVESFCRGLIKLIGGKDASKERIIEELADVTVLLEQIRLYYEIPEKEIIKVKWEKVERQLERIANE